MDPLSFIAGMAFVLALLIVFLIWFGSGWS